MNNLESNLIKKVLKTESDDTKKVIKYELMHHKKDRVCAVKHGNVFFHLSHQGKRKLRRELP